MEKSIQIFSKVFVAGLYVLFVLFIVSACKSNPIPMTQEEKEYIDWYDDFNGRIYDSNQMYKDALNDYAEDPSDTYTQLVLARELVRLGNIYYEEATEKEAPTSLSNLHKELISALSEFKAANDALTSEEPAMFLTHMKNGEKQLLDLNKTYREWLSGHY